MTEQDIRRTPTEPKESNGKIDLEVATIKSLPGELEDNYPAPNLDPVGSSESLVVKRPGVVETDGLGPCLGLVVMDHKTGKAAVYHFITPSSISDVGFLRAIPEIHAHYEKFGEPKVYLAGCGEFRTCEHSGGIDVRDFVLEKLVQAGIRQTDLLACWAESNESQFMHVDTKAKKVTVFAYVDDLDDL